ncbi:MAG: hypothetical protein WBD36_04275 [Bacteroidota bacterium]
MLKSLCVGLLTVCLLGAMSTQAQQKSTTVVRSTLEDESIGISVDKPVYFPGDVVRLTILREDSTSGARVTPIVAIEGMKLRSAGHDVYTAVIPKNVTPGAYRILLRIVDEDGRQFVYETGRTVDVEEYQTVEQVSGYVSIAPVDGSDDPQTAATLDREQIRALQIVFQRDSIHVRMGPQFVTIRTSVLLRDGTAMQAFERRVVTFRSHGNPERDRAMFIQYRTAYGAYAAISPAELEVVHLPFDSLPAWSMIKVSIEPDYTIKIGAYDRTNSMTRYFRVRGPSLEIGFLLGIPKVLYDSRSEDTIQYGHTSAMMRFYYVSARTGNRFPVSLGMGTFGVNSPIDVGPGQGGFALSVFLDLVELMKALEIEFIKRVNLGLEVTPFFTIGRRSRLLFDAQVSFAI